MGYFQFLNRRYAARCILNASYARLHYMHIFNLREHAVSHSLVLLESLRSGTGYSAQLQVDQRCIHKVDRQSDDVVQCRDERAHGAGWVNAKPF